MDNTSALQGMLGYRYICDQVGDVAESNWATDFYAGLLNDANNAISQTIQNNGLNYIPFEMFHPNDYFRWSQDPKSGAWANPFHMGRWFWDGFLFIGDQYGPLIDRVESTYDYGIARIATTELPYGDVGGWGTDSPYKFSNAYNVGQQAGCFIGTRHRDYWYYGYRFMLDYALSGPNCYYEAHKFPSNTTGWEGTHPEEGFGSCPHSWGIAVTNKVFIEALIAERIDGTVIIGRGIPDHWVDGDDSPISISNHPLTAGRRFGYELTSTGKYIDIAFSGDQPAGEIWIDLPIFIGNDQFTATAGVVDYNSNRLILPSGTESVLITLTGTTIPVPEITQITAVNGSQVELFWQDNSSGEDQEDGFVVQRRPYQGLDQWHQVGQVGPDVTEFLDTNQVFGLIEYRYRVGAVKQ